MNDELKYCKFCDKEKPIKEFVKSGFAIKNICKECNNEKYKKKYKAEKNWNELKKWLEEEKKEHEIWLETKMVYAYKDVLEKMQELEGNNE